jgi:uncharacterized ubiquitin-like protein YukD
MNRVRSILQRAIAKQERQLGNPFFLFKGQKIPCLPGKAVSEFVDTYGGPDDRAEFELVVRKNLFLTVDNIDITIDSTNFTVDRYGNILPNYDARRNTIDAWVQARRALVLDNDAPAIMTIDNNCVAIDYDQPWPLDTFPTVDSVSITIDNDGSVTVDGYSPGVSGSTQPHFPAVPGKNPVTIDASDITIDHDDETLTVDRHVSEVGYFDPILLPDFRNLYLDLIDTDIEADKSRLNLDTTAAFTMGVDDFDRPFRVPGVYQEDQGLSWGRRPQQGEIIEYMGQAYRVASDVDPGVHSAFYRIRLSSAYL